MEGCGRKLIYEVAHGVLRGVVRQTKKPLAPPALVAKSGDGIGAPSVSSCRKNFRSASTGGTCDQSSHELTAPRVWTAPGRASFIAEQTAVVGALHGEVRRAGLHVGRIVEMAHPPEPKTYGVGPTMAAERDPQSKGNTPDDFRADHVHMVEPKEVTKEKAAAAQQEPPDFQVQKIAAERVEPTKSEAQAQRDPGEQVFDPNTLEVEGTAENQGDISSLKSDKVEASYGTSMPSKDEVGTGTSRS